MSNYLEPKTRRKIAREYYQTSFTTNEISQRNGISPSAITQLASDYNWMSFTKDKLDTVIKVKNEDLERVLILLEESNIKHEIPQNFELIERFESKINK